MKIMAGEKVKRLKTENGGIIHNIASHLPASVPGKNFVPEFCIRIVFMFFFFFFFLTRSI